MCEVTEECPSVIGSSLYICDASERRTRWCRPAFLLFFLAAAPGWWERAYNFLIWKRIGRGAMFVQPRGLLRIVVCATQCRSSVCAAETRGSGRRHFFFFLLFWRFSVATALREESRNALSLGGTAYMIYLCATHFEYIYILCVYR